MSGTFSKLKEFFVSRWWVNYHSEDWHEWAKIEHAGRVSIYDMNGEFVRGTDYGSRRQATTSLSRMGYRRMRRKDRKKATPPDEQHGKLSTTESKRRPQDPAS